MRFLAAILLCSVTLTGHAFAQAGSCVSTGDHLINVSNNEELGIDDLGDSIAVYALDGSTEPTCSFDPASALFVLEGAYIFVAAIDTHLVTAEASARDRLMIHDLDTGKLLLDVDANAHMISSSEVAFWEVRGEATPETCDRYDEYVGYGGSAVMAHEVRYSFADRTLADTGASRCAYRQ